MYTLDNTIFSYKYDNGTLKIVLLDKTTNCVIFDMLFNMTINQLCAKITCDEAQLHGYFVKFANSLGVR